MNAKQLAIGSFTVAVITFIVAAAVSFIYSLIAHGSATVDWEHSIRLAIILGIIVPLLRKLEKKQKSS